MRQLSVLAATIMTAAMVGMAPAQTFELETVSARPGQTAQLKLYVTSPVALAAVNFTIKLDSASVSGNVTGVKAPTGSLSSFTYVGNSTTAGNAREYRGVLYSETPSTTFSAAAKTHIATISVPVGSSAQLSEVTVDVANTFDTDGITALLGASNAAGQSLVGGAPIAAGAVTRPAATDGKVKIDPVFTDITFKGGNLPPGWTYGQVLPASIAQLPTPAGNTAGLLLPGSVNGTDGVVFGQNADPSNIGAFGQMVQGDGSDFFMAQTDSVVFYTWDVASNAAEGNDVPSMRLRFSARDFSWVQNLAISEFSNTAPIVVPTNGQPRVLTAASYVPGVANNNVPSGVNGFLAAFDLLRYNVGQQGTNLLVSNLRVTSTPVSALTGVQQHYQHDFTTGNLDGFNLELNGLVNPSSATPADYQCTINTTAGISIRPNSAVVDNVPAGSGTFYFPFATFGKPLGASTPLDSDRLYRIDVNAATTAGATRPANFRVRVTAGGVLSGDVPQADVSQEIVVAAADSLDTANPVITPAGTTFSSFFVLPDEIDNGRIALNFDVYAVGQVTDAVIVRSVNVRSYNMP
jgi:hypothetical protein